MADKELSVIIPFCNEVPQVVFTIQAIIEELDSFCKYEVIVVDNMSDPYMDCTTDISFDEKRKKIVGEKARTFYIRQRSYFDSPIKKTYINTWFFRKGIVKYLQYDKKQGHWNAKNHGIENSTGKFLFFLDAHCIMKRDSVRKMVEFLRNPPEEKIGGVHAYINYMLDSRSLEYRVQRKTFGYCFCTHQIEPYYETLGHAVGVRKLRFPTKPYKVCVMSTCGMMSPRSVIEELGGWHPEFGIYAGGESYMNWKQSTCGYHHWIHPEAWCWHWAEKRGYCYNHRDLVRNSFIAAYVVGGHEWLNQQVESRKRKENPKIIDELAADVIEKCHEERQYIKSKQVETLTEYMDRWEANPGVWK